MSPLFTWGGQSTGVSALASFLLKNTQDLSPLEWAGWISLQSKGLSRVFFNTTVQKYQFFITIPEKLLQNIIQPGKSRPSGWKDPSGQLIHPLPNLPSVWGWLQDRDLRFCSSLFTKPCKISPSAVITWVWNLPSPSPILHILGPKGPWIPEESGSWRDLLKTKQLPRTSLGPMLSGPRSSDCLQSHLTIPWGKLRMQSSAGKPNHCLFREWTADLYGWNHRWKVKEDVWWGHTVNILKYLSTTGCFLWQQEAFSEFSKVPRKTFCFWAMLGSMWGLSSWTRGLACTPFSGNSES